MGSTQSVCSLCGPAITATPCGSAPAGMFDGRKSGELALSESVPFGGDRQHVKSVALRESARGVGLMVDHIERVAARIESEFKIGGFARGSRIAGRILGPAQHEFLDLNGLQGIRQREHADAVRAGIDRVQELAVRAHQRPAWTTALNGDGTGKGQVAGAIEREDADLIGPGQSGVDDALCRVLGQAQEQRRSHGRPHASAGNGRERSIRTDLEWQHLIRVGHVVERRRREGVEKRQARVGRDQQLGRGEADRQCRRVRASLRENTISAEC